MLETTASHLSTTPPASSSVSSHHHHVSVASVTNALHGLSAHHSSHPAEPKRSITTEIHADIEAIMLYRVDEIELSRAAYFFERLVAVRDELAGLAARELVDAVDRVVARMREWVRADEVAGRGAGAVIFGNR